MTGNPDPNPNLSSNPAPDPDPKSNPEAPTPTPPARPKPQPHSPTPTKAAYYELFGRVVCVYEPVQTKSFLHGRTEAARTMTAEAAHFVRPGTSS